MRLRRSTAAVFLLLAAAAPAAAADKTGPPVVFQTAPAGKLLADARAAAKMAGGDMVEKMLDEWVANTFGERGMASIDRTKSAAGYVIPGATFEKTSLILLVPVANEDDFLDLIKSKLEAIVVGPKDAVTGLYKLAPKDDGGDPPPSFLRFHAGYAYFGINVSADAMAAKALLPAPDVIDAKETATFAVRTFPDRYPPELVKTALEKLDGFAGEIAAEAGKAGPDWGDVPVKALAKLARRYVGQVLTETEQVTLKFNYDTKAGEQAYEIAVTPKPGSALAKDLAARKPTTNRFAGLAGPDAVGGVMFKLPLFADEIREAAAGLIVQGEKMAADAVPPPAAPVAAEFFKSLTKTVKTGNFDAAAVLTGPDKDGHFTAVVAVVLEDAAAVEKALRVALPAAPKEVRDGITLDAEKIGDVNIHKITIDEPPPGVTKVFGTTSGYVAFGPQGVYVAYGLDAIPQLKKALALKPAPAKVVDVVVNPRRAGQLATALNDEAGKMVARMIGTGDKPVTVMAIAVDAGGTLRIRVTQMMSLGGVGTFGVIR